MTSAIHPVLHHFFAVEGDEEKEILARSAEMRSVGEGESLYSAGDEAENLFVVLEGRFAVHKSIGVGNRSQVVALLDAGTVVGENVFGRGRHRSSTVVAVSEALVAVFSRETLAAIERQRPLLLIGLLKKVLSISSIRLQKSSERLTLVL